MNQKDNTLIAWLTLAHAPQIGICTIRKLLQQFDTVIDICNASVIKLNNSGLSSQQANYIKHTAKPGVEQALNWLNQSKNHHILHFDDSRYPTLLKEIPQPPAILYLSGNPNLLTMPQIAIIGSRNPSYSGLENAHSFAHQLSQHHLCITSGLALGIDAAAHRSALQAQQPTIAVLGTGLNHIYPKRHLSLAHEITNKGCLISEFPLNTLPKPDNFPRRNRIISGLSLGTLVVEAAVKSGSLITARYAMEQNREVFALPGSINNPTAKGCLKLIQEGAKCVTDIKDILCEINILANISSSPHQDLNLVTLPSYKPETLTTNEQTVLHCIENDCTTTIDQICERSKLAAQKVIAAVSSLELQRLIVPIRNGYTKTGKD